MAPARPSHGPSLYSATCHPPESTRRSFLVGGTALAGSAAARPRVARASDDGVAIIRQYASAPDDPWAVSHGVRAMGADFRLGDGRRAVDFLLESRLASLRANGRSVLAFPIEAEVHPNAFLKTMLEAGVPLSRGFTFEGSRYALRDVVDGARALFRPSRVGSSANMLPWSVIAFVLTTPPARPRWTNAWGEAVDLDSVVGESLRLLEQASLPLMEAMRDGKPTMVAPVHGFTCGGTHLLYALLTAMKAGYTGRDRLERTRRQVDLLVVRLTTDIQLIERFYGERTRRAGRHWFELGAKLKLLGHAEECLAFGTRHGVVSLNAAQQAQRRRAVTTLRQILDEAEQRDIREVRAVDAELFRQLVGDTCHARHGLVLA